MQPAGKPAQIREPRLESNESHGILNRHMGVYIGADVHARLFSEQRQIRAGLAAVLDDNRMHRTNRRHRGQQGFSEGGP